MANRRMAAGSGGTVTGAPMSAAEAATEPYIDKQEVARRLGRTRRAVEKMMRRGLIPYYKPAHGVMFRWSEIQARLAETCRICRRRGGPR